MVALTTVAIAGVGDVGRHIIEELEADGRFHVIALARSQRPWFADHNVHVEITDYSESSVLPILNKTKASALISFINNFGDEYVDTHNALLAACQKSETCKRFIPSEWVGDIETYPDLPRVYNTSRRPFRKTLEQSSGVEWTLMNIGWIMDYFGPKEKTYIKPLPAEWPIDLNSWSAVVRATGDEPNSWTSARDIGKALAALLSSSTPWEPITYISGEWNSWNATITILEDFYAKRMTRTHRSNDEIQAALEKYGNDEEAPEYFTAVLDEWMVAGAAQVPKEKALQQREKYFSGVKFLGLSEFLQFLETIEHV